MWACEWYSKNKLDGERRYLIRDKRIVLLFITKQQACEYISRDFGYIKARKDLRNEPHGWRLPKAVKVEVIKVAK